MRRWSFLLCSLTLAITPLTLAGSTHDATPRPGAAEPAPELPWRAAGLTERQAAAHLLDRFAFGARPGDIDQVIALGLEHWLELQLAGQLGEPEVARRLAGFRSLHLDTHEIVDRYPSAGRIARALEKEGKLDPKAKTSKRDGAFRDMVMTAARERGYRPQRELIAELYVQKLVRATYGANQLHEVLTDFWFNHFNVSITDNEVRTLVTTYERDAIRPHVTGTFRTMLEATARHPAMLMYLDNARSTAAADAPRSFDADSYRQRPSQRAPGRRARRAGRSRPADQRPSRRPSGLNENYARELLELHTLGVEGGYNQDDVIAVARAFSGWTVLPPKAMLDSRAQRRLARARQLPEFVIDGAFLFRADMHDAGPKTVLSTKLPAGRGIEDGRAVLDLLATHPSTALHIARKLAIRFVADTPPPALVDALARQFRVSQGDLAATLRTLAYAPGFWSDRARQQKIKSPFELAVSAVRALGADVSHPRELLEWINQMGQPLYAYQAPTGYPDRADAWVNTGSLLARMRFGLALGAGQVRGVLFDPIALNQGQEPPSIEAALQRLVPRLLPGRDRDAIVERLLPLVHDPDLPQRLAETPKDRRPPTYGFDDDARDDDARDGRPDQRLPGLPRQDSRQRWPRHPSFSSPPPAADHGMLGHVVGIILGSPAFQRR